ncbi:DUF4260 domain-containing protein [Sutcliffiella halmapala]|uniref:DUF4260 domain-containing protein n=1 Tax=Sutcliffiella halmapala TaxID=79882 RepID=UPI000995CC71|nr:DUF4260 domain-containing protein [Sutcliffiella halmapala]
MNKILLHLEGAFILLISLYFYSSQQFSWLVFAIFLLAPDLAMVGYLKNNKFGAIIYNLFHTYCFPIVIIIFGIFLKNDLLLQFGLIWSAHIGMDRMFGYGLKNPTNFKDTHLNRI